MSLKLLPMEEADLDVYENVAWAAFKDDIMGLLYPYGYTEAAREWFMRYAIEDWRKQPDKFQYLKVVDTSLPDDDPNNKIVGVASWKFYLKDRTAAELDAEDKESDERGFPPDANVPLFEEFFANIAKYKREIVGGKAYILLNLLATLPDHHRRGVGAMHLKWGNEQANKLGLQCYLEASPMGRPLYERYGYEVVRDFPFDARAWGLGRDLPHVCMLRPASEMN